MEQISALCPPRSDLTEPTGHALPLQLSYSHLLFVFYSIRVSNPVPTCAQMVKGLLPLQAMAFPKSSIPNLQSTILNPSLRSSSFRATSATLLQSPIKNPKSEILNPQFPHSFREKITKSDFNPPSSFRHDHFAPSRPLLTALFSLPPRLFLFRFLETITNLSCGLHFQSSIHNPQSSIPNL